VRRGATTGDVLIFLATLSIAAALLYPAWSVRGFRSRVETAISDVDAVAAAARSVRENSNRWPPSTPPGEAPPELSGLSGTDGPFAREAYSLGWSAWDVVDSVQAPQPTTPSTPGDAPLETAPPVMMPILRSVGAVTVHSADASLLAELQQHYSDATSFGVDSMWLLVLPERAQATTPR
jgi:hypothetical protein